MDLLTLILLAFGGGFASTHYVIYRLRNSNKMKSVMIMELKIENVLESILNHTIIDRALLCKVHNGGTPILVGSEKKISIIVEPDDSLRPHTQATYTAFPIDNNYKRILIEMMDRKDMFVIHKISEEQDSVFFRKSEADGLVEVMHYYVGESETGVYYLFLGTLTGPGEILRHNTQRNRIEEQLVVARKLVKKAIRKKRLK